MLIRNILSGDLYNYEFVNFRVNLYFNHNQTIFPNLVADLGKFQNIFIQTLIQTINVKEQQLKVST